MDQGHTKNMKGRLRIAAVTMVCLVAIVALPAFAFAAAPWSGEAPVGTLVLAPTVVAADITGPALNSTTASMSINGIKYPATVIKQGVTQGTWTASAPILQPNGTYRIVWTWSAPGVRTYSTVYCLPPASAMTNGVKNVVVSVKNTAVPAVQYNDSWSFTIAVPVPNPPPTPTVSNNSQVCAVCHEEFVDAVDMGPNCLECHANGYETPSHATITGNAPGRTIADGHKIGGTLLGPLTKFDGSQGVTLEWESEFASATLNASYATNLGVTSLTTGQVGTLVTNWTFPTSGVFWISAEGPVPPNALADLTSSSVIGCTDCHSSAGITYGPHGAISWGMDPNYPGDYSYAELTKYVTANPAWPVTSPNYVALSKSGIAMFPGAATHADITSTTVNTVPAGALTALANRTDGTTGPTAVICAKCHNLESVSSSATVTGDNTAHNSHHQDQLDGSAQCVNCHIGVPHAWKRPRLLVNTDVDVAPMLDAEHLGTTRSTSTGEVNTGDTRKPFGSGFGAGFNGQGMQSLSGWDQHTLITVGNTTGMTLWTEASCQACGDHAGEDGVRIVEGE